MASRPRDALIAHRVQPPPRHTASGDTHRRRDFEQGFQHERTLVHPWMRKCEPRLPRPASTVEQKVEIKRTRRVAYSARSLIAMVTTLDRLHAVKKASRRQPGAQRGDSVHVVRLRLLAAQRGAQVIS